ncbi:MAG: ergothioneine biosynthesis protein EgtB, partial [Pseudoxanthomonas sp.]
MSASPVSAAASVGAPDLRVLAQRYAAVRARSVALAAPLSAEDAMVQSMDDASPAKWHLAHTTWFF